MIDRRELPIQSVSGRLPDLTVTIPIARSILALDAELRMDPSLIADSAEVARLAYEADTQDYRASLEHWGDSTSELDGYDTWPEAWGVAAEPADNGFLSLCLTTDAGSYRAGLVGVPVHMINYENDGGDFWSPEDLTARHAAPVFYRGQFDSDVIFMPPERLQEYGTALPRDPEADRFEVIGDAFCTDYLPRMQEAFALRVYGSMYLNAIEMRHLGQEAPDSEEDSA